MSSVLIQEASRASVLFVPAMILGRGGEMSSLKHVLSALQSEQKLVEGHLRQVRKAVAVLRGLGGQNT